MPQTAMACAIGVLALAGFPLLSGFWSKDAVLAVALHRARYRSDLGGMTLEVGADSWAAGFGFVIALAVAGLTAFYAARMWILAFWGDPRSEPARNARESPAVMTVPLWLLAIPSVGIGALLEQDHRLARTLFAGAAPHATPNWGVGVTASAIALAGLALAWRLYARPSVGRDPVERMPAGAYRLLVNLWGIDKFWTMIGAGGALAAGRVIAWFDRRVVDGAMNGIAWLIGRGGAGLRRTCTGQAQSYAAVLLGAILLMAGWLLLRS
jgi:NADH-quinone oxidoreductase subunit L